MPLLEFRCDHCCESKEVLRGLETMSDAELCVTCGDPMRKVITTTNFTLKGNGWAKDGYK